MKGNDKHRVFITGANGLIGSHITEYFSDMKISLVCGVRKSADISHISNLPVEVRYIDIRHLDSLITSFNDCDFVIHTAGLTNDWSKYRDTYETNVVGTLNVLRACKINGIKNVIITGSIASYGEENSIIIKDENSPFKPRQHYFLEKLIPSRMNFYRISKAECTRQATDFGSKNNLNITIIEPVWVYGEYEFSSGFYEYLKIIKSGISFFPGSKKNKFHVIYARDLAKAYYLAYDKNLSGINRFIIGNNNIDSMEYIYSLFCKQINSKKPRNIPRLLANPVGIALEFFAEIFNLKNPPALTRARVDMMYDNIEYSIKKAEHILGFKNEFTLEEGVHRTVSWYIKNKYL